MPFAAQTMQPDVPPPPPPAPAAPPAPAGEIPVVATNAATGQKVTFDMSDDLRAAVNTAINAHIANHPVIGAVAVKARGRERADRTLMQQSLIDVAVAVIAGLFTIVSPDSSATGVLWVAAAALASKTLLSAAIDRAGVAP